MNVYDKDLAGANAARSFSLMPQGDIHYVDKADADER